MARCFVTRVLPGPALDRLRFRHEVEVWPERLPPPYEELAARAADADGLLTLLTDRVDAALIEHCPVLRAISNYAVGYDNIDVDAAAARGIAVGNTPDVLTEATADLTFALLLAAARKLPEAMSAVAQGDWVTWEPGRYLGAAVSLEALLADSDFVSLHCPLTRATHHLIDADALARMRPTAILINTSRGPIVDQTALTQALLSGQIAGAALDVTDPEPPAPHDPLLSAPNLLVVPHIGSATRAARERMAELAVENLLAGLDGRPMPHQVHAEA